MSPIVGIGINVAPRGFNWRPLSLVVEDAEPNKVVMTGSVANTKHL